MFGCCSLLRHLLLLNYFSPNGRREVSDIVTLLLDWKWLRAQESDSTPGIVSTHLSFVKKVTWWEITEGICLGMANEQEVITKIIFIAVFENME